MVLEGLVEVGSGGTGGEFRFSWGLVVVEGSVVSLVGGSRLYYGSDCGNVGLYKFLGFYKFLGLENNWLGFRSGTEMNFLVYVRFWW